MNTNWWNGASPQQKNWFRIGAAVLVVLALLVVYNMAKPATIAGAEGQTQTAATVNNQPYPFASVATAALEDLEKTLMGGVQTCQAQESPGQCFSRRFDAVNAAATIQANTNADLTKKLAECERYKTAWRTHELKGCKERNQNCGKPAKPAQPQPTATNQPQQPPAATPMPNNNPGNGSRTGRFHDLWASLAQTQTQSVGDVSGGDAQVGDVTSGDVTGGDITIHPAAAPSISFAPVFSPTFNPTLSVTPGGTTVIVVPWTWRFMSLTDLCEELKTWYDRQDDSWKRSAEGVKFLEIMMKYCGNQPQPTATNQPPQPSPTATPVVNPPTQAPQFKVNGHLMKESGPCGADYKVTTCDNKISWIRCNGGCDGKEGQYVEVLWTLHDDCFFVISIILPDAVNVISPDPCPPGQPTATQVVGPPTQAPATPTNQPPQPNCGRPSIYKFEPEQCRTGLSFAYPLYVCWERTKTQPVTPGQPFVEGCWIMMNGLQNATLVGEGQIGLFAPGTSYDCILADLQGHIVRRNAAMGASYIGLLSNGEADARKYGYLADQCPAPPPPPPPTQPPTLVCNALEYKGNVTGTFTVPTGQYWHATMWLTDWPSNPQEWSVILRPGYVGEVQPAARVPDVWVYGDENKATECGKVHIAAREKAGYPHTWADDAIRKRVFKN